MLVTDDYGLILGSNAEKSAYPYYIEARHKETAAYDRLCVRVEAAKKIGYAEIGEKDKEEGNDAADIVEGLRAVRPKVQVRNDERPMEQDGIDEHGDERPCFFRVPSPIASPGHIRPDGSNENAGSEAELGGIQ